MTIVETRAVTGGVDTHLDVHVAAVLDDIGGLLGVESFPTTAVGLLASCWAGWLRSASSSGSASRAPVPMAPAWPATSTPPGSSRGGEPFGPPGPPTAGKSDPLDAVAPPGPPSPGRPRERQKAATATSKRSAR